MKNELKNCCECLFVSLNAPLVCSYVSCGSFTTTEKTNFFNPYFFLTLINFFMKFLHHMMVLAVTLHGLTVLYGIHDRHCLDYYVKGAEQTGLALISFEVISRAIT